jgi:DNA-binding GntR family transcriptional regulator
MRLWWFVCSWKPDDVACRPTSSHDHRDSWQFMSKKTKRPRQPSRTADQGGRRGRPKGTGSHTIYTKLRQRILRLDLAPGADIDELALVRQFKLSRTPVREGLLRLAHEGLVEIVPNRGARVAALNFHEVPEIFDALEIAIRITSRWAALRRTPADLDAIRLHSQNFADAAANGDFHRMTEANRNYHVAIAEAAGNRHFVRLLDSLLSMTSRYAYMTLARGSTIENIFPGGFPQINQEHDDLIELIEAADAAGADQLAGKHARMFRAKVSELMNKGPAASTPLDDPAAG